MGRGVHWSWLGEKNVHACHVPVCQWEEATPYFGAPTPFWHSRPHLEISRLQLYPSRARRRLTLKINDFRPLWRSRRLRCERTVRLQKAMMSLKKYEACTFQSQNAAQMFLCKCVSEGNRLSSETCRWHFHFILPIMPDKAAYMSAVLLCVQLLTYRRSRYLLLKRHLMAESESAFPVCVFLMFRSMRISTHVFMQQT